MITLEQLPAGQVLDAANGAQAPTETTPIERAGRKQQARLRNKGRIKPAAAIVAPVAKKAGKPASQTVAEIHAACTALAIEVKPFGSGSFVLRLPAWAEFKARLPQDGTAKAEAKLFHSLRDALTGLTGDAKATWVLHRTGSFAVYSKFAK